jgi:hypothetical protein
VPQRASSRLKLQNFETGRSSNLVWRRWSSYTERFLQNPLMVPSQYDGAGCRAGRLWRGVGADGRSRGRLPAPARELSQVQTSSLAQKCLIDTVGDGVRFTPNSGHVAAPQ